MSQCEPNFWARDFEPEPLVPSIFSSTHSFLSDHRVSAHGKKKETLARTGGVLRWCLPIRLHVYIPFGLFRNLAAGNPNQLVDPGARLNPESRDPDKEKKRFMPSNWWQELGCVLDRCSQNIMAPFFPKTILCSFSLKVRYLKYRRFLFSILIKQVAKLRLTFGSYHFCFSIIKLEQLVL